MRNLTQIQEIPEPFQEEVFQKLFEVAEIAKFNPTQVRFYEDSLKYYRDLQNTIDTARDEGLDTGIEIGKEQGIEIGEERGRLKAMAQMACNLLRIEMSDAQILSATGLTPEQLEQLKKR
ncbi:MAG: PD-(D/E)XK nuclease family transposase [Cyanobacteria bacterium P01_G01_bin.54]